MSIRNRITKLEKDQPIGTGGFAIYRTIVSRMSDGKLTERLATIRQSGMLFRRRKDETETAFIARVDEAQEGDSK